MNQFNYTAYGLNFSSTIALPELGEQTNKNPDILISLGNVPESLPEKSENGIAWQSAPGQLLLSVNDVARYLILDNQQVIIQPINGSTEADIRIFLLGSVLGALLHARRMLVLHAGVVKTKNGAIILMGKSGVGKSTLTAGFVQRGYSILADDKAGIIVDENGIAKVLPGFPLIRMNKDSARALNFEIEAKRFNTHLGKYVLPIENFCHESVRIHTAYLIETHNKSEIVLTELDPMRKFQALNQGIYRRKFSQKKEQRLAHFQTLTTLATQARVVNIKRPDNTNLITDLIKKIEEDFGK